MGWFDQSQQEREKELEKKAARKALAEAKKKARADARLDRQLDAEQKRLKALNLRAPQTGEVVSAKDDYKLTKNEYNGFAKKMIESGKHTALDQTTGRITNMKAFQAVGTYKRRIGKKQCPMCGRHVVKRGYVCGDCKRDTRDLPDSSFLQRQHSLYTPDGRNKNNLRHDELYDKNQPKHMRRKIVSDDQLARMDDRQANQTLCGICGNIYTSIRDRNQCESYHKNGTW